MFSRIGVIVPKIAVGCAIVFCSIAAPAVAQEAAKLTINEFGVGTEVVDRQLKGKSDRFEQGTQVVFWTRVIGGEAGERIRHVWSHDGKEVISIGLTLGGSHWRTYSRKTLHPGSVGKWTVEARDAEDNVLATAEFTCVSPGSSGETPE